VITEERVMTLLEHADPVSSLDLKPVDVDAASYLATLEQRSSEMTQIETNPETKPPGRSRGPLIAAAVAAVALIATIGILLTNNDEQPAAQTTAPVVPTTAPVVPTTIENLEGLSIREARRVANSFFPFFNAGDVDGVMALLTSDVVISDNLEREWDLGEWEQYLTWEAAQEATLGQRKCQILEEASDEDEVTVICVTETIDGVTRATDSYPVGITIIMTVTSEGISGLSFRYDRSDPDLTVVFGQFEDWMDVQFPEDPHAADYGNWTSPDEAEQNGLLRVQRIDEWVSFATGVVEQTFVDFNTGDLDVFLANFSTGAREDAEEFFSAQMTANTQYRLEQCAPFANEWLPGGILIECEFTTTDGRAGTELMQVNAQGKIIFRIPMN